ncbi:esterase/lipase [Streptohalobacillus salinus]|uniref:Esterase/lipase n=1 Tax=Streptohalobacillus salinus TaxID=621096 RepID=A0A2V3W7N3_9BACI|nr:alpha/beta fold hydrolase [Streptohalobacillus salinus]PXW89168.1 esterase/lipase [Streptohalobacillus salinus]
MIGVLLLHGFTGGPHELEPLTTFFQDTTDWDVVVPTLPGHGLDLQLAGHSYEEWIETAEEAFLALQDRVDKIFLVGFSMGGMIAGYLAGKYHVDKLIMLSPSRKYLDLKQMTEKASQLLKDSLVGELEENFTYKMYQHKRGKIPVKSYIEFMKCMEVTKSYLKKIDAEVLVLQGIQDGLVPYQSSHELDREIPGDIEVIYYSDSTHMIILGDDKKRVIHAVYTFLTRPNERNIVSSKAHPLNRLFRSRFK